VTITFGPAARVGAWLEETQSPFQLLLDKERVAYEAYGVQRSLAASMSIAAVLKTRQLVKQGMPAHGVQGDPAQLGGNFIVDAAGAVRFAHRSKDPTDYPPVKVLITMLETLRSDVEQRGIE
jgi:hypothetical protein